ncbi:hypothetical protein C8Q80DRAFT_1267504 [Daedaleopsis nitida]|nr:hypothetical protein C8Q80DRAFT_1267504 [Daedaleopsis nitida]
MLSTLENLPTELVLRILAYLPLQSLRALRLASRTWNTFFVDNESSIYHHAALLHRFIDSIHTLLPQAKDAHPLKFLQDAPDWLTYCRKYYQLQQNWMGKGSAKARYFGNNPYDIHRIKVDELYGLLIVTHEFGGLTVFDLDTAEILWQLDSVSVFFSYPQKTAVDPAQPSKGYVRRYAHCEYENGYLVFDRFGSAKEIWRLDVLFDAAEKPCLNLPDDDQMSAWKKASRDFASTGPRGHFRPWALIETADHARAYRFVYPTLLVCGLRKAYLWNVCTAELLLEVDNVQGNAGGGDINYVELSGTHVFVCSTSALRVFARRHGEMVLEIKSYQLVYSDVRLAVQLDPAVARRKYADAAEAVCLPAEPTLTTALYTASYAEFSAARHSGEVSMKAATLEIGKTIPRIGATDEHFSIYLAFEHGRLGVITTSGVYTATLDPTYHGLFDEDTLRAGKNDAYRIPRSSIDAGLSHPYITFVSLPFYHDRRQLAKVTCAQITETKLFFIWDAMYKPENIEFFRQLGMIGGSPPIANDSSADVDAPVVADDDDLEVGLFTTADTLAQAAAQEAGASQEEDDDWEGAAVEEPPALLSLSSSAGAQLDTTEAEPSSSLVDALMDDDADDVHDHDDDDIPDDHDHDAQWDDDSDTEEGDEPATQNVHPFAGFVRDSPIVFCIDFSPQ